MALFELSQSSERERDRAMEIDEAREAGLGFSWGKQGGGRTARS